MLAMDDPAYRIALAQGNAFNFTSVQALAEGLNLTCPMILAAFRNER
jgi:hypothetical protein